MMQFTKFQKQKGNAAGLTLFQVRSIITPPFVFENSEVNQIQANENQSFETSLYHILSLALWITGLGFVAHIGKLIIE